MEKMTFKIIQTDDGSSSFYSNIYAENGHSTHGAKLETIKHYVTGCQVMEKLQSQSTLRILEVGFGIGVGFEQTYETIQNSQVSLDKLQFVSLEIDENLVKHVQQNNSLFSELKFVSTPYPHYKMIKNKIELIILIGDARKSIKTIQEPFDCIYQDAFSPKKNAILWTTEWFKDLFKLSNEKTILSTYSSSSSIRKSLIAAGWLVTKGEQFGPKRSSTRALTSGATDQDILEHLNRSPAIELTDDNYQEYTIEKTHEKNN